MGIKTCKDLLNAAMLNHLRCKIEMNKIVNKFQVIE